VGTLAIETIAAVLLGTAELRVIAGSCVPASLLEDLDAPCWVRISRPAQLALVDHASHSRLELLPRTGCETLDPFTPTDMALLPPTAQRMLWRHLLLELLAGVRLEADLQRIALVCIHDPALPLAARRELQLALNDLGLGHVLLVDHHEAGVAGQLLQRAHPLATVTARLAVEAEINLPVTESHACGSSSPTLSALIDVGGGSCRIALGQRDPTLATARTFAWEAPADRVLQGALILARWLAEGIVVTVTPHWQLAFSLDGEHASRLELTSLPHGGALAAQAIELDPTDHDPAVVLLATLDARLPVRSMIVCDSLRLRRDRLLHANYRGVVVVKLPGPGHSPAALSWSVQLIESAVAWRLVQPDYLAGACWALGSA
jgi:hypothetical protein